MNFQYQVRLTLNQCNLTYAPTSKLSLYTFAKALDIWLFGQSTLEKVTQLSSWDFGRLCWLGHRCWTLCQRARTSYDFLSAPFNMTKVAGEDFVLTETRPIWRLAHLLFIFPVEEALQDCWRGHSPPSPQYEWVVKKYRTFCLPPSHFIDEFKALFSRGYLLFTKKSMSWMFLSH